MDEKPTEPPNEAGLHEYVDAEFTVAGLESPARETALHDALEKLSGLEKLSIFQAQVKELFLVARFRDRHFQLGFCNVNI